eukprot:3389726-Rhodomonas_salina.1
MLNHTRCTSPAVLVVQTVLKRVLAGDGWAEKRVECHHVAVLKRLAVVAAGVGSEGLSRAGWNWLDMIVVIVSLFSLAFEGVPFVKTIRILRAF